MLYHYTDRLSMADVHAARITRAAPQILHRDMLARDAGLATPPLVWLSTDPRGDGTVLAKLRAGGWPMPPVGDLCRVVLPAGYGGDVGLGEYTDAAGIDPEWWAWVVRTGQLAGSDYTTWRLVDRDIPAADWLAVEALAADLTWAAWSPPGN